MGLLDPYIPTPSRPWNKRMILHLLNRTTYGASVADVNSLLSLTPSDAVDLLFQNVADPAPPGSWVTEVPDFNSPYNTLRFQSMRNWWLKLMYSQPVSIKEKMVMFWHGLFTSEDDVVRIPQWMYFQNKLFRDNAFGNYKDLAKKVTTDPAMLYYLDGRLNVVNNPNENYSRELLELFTIGIGNYTELDVREGARALTGWITNGLVSQFVASRHDSGNKTYFGQTGNWDNNNVIDIIFQQNQTAVTFCTRLYKTFVHQTENMTYALPVINELADLLRSGNYDVQPVLKKILKSQIFFSENVMCSVYKSPVESMIGSIRSLGIQLDPAAITTDLTYVSSQASSANQLIFSPPNVQGWPGFKQWINTLSLPVRNSYLESIITGIKKDNTPTGFSVDPVAFALSFPHPQDAVLLVDDISEHLIRIKLTVKQKAYLLDSLLDGSAVYDWNVNDPQAPARIKKFLKAIMYLAEFQLV